MKVLSLPRLPKYKPLWVTAKDWRRTKELPQIQTGQPKEEEGAGEEEQNGGAASQGGQLPPLSNKGGRTSRHKRRLSPFSVLFHIGELPSPKPQAQAAVAVDPPAPSDSATTTPTSESPPPPPATSEPEDHDWDGRPEQPDEAEEQEEEERVSLFGPPQDTIPRIRIPPRLGLRVLERQVVTLSKDGQVGFAREELLSLVEGEYASDCPQRLQLRQIPKAQALMRKPLMPCLALNHAHTAFPGWPEPIRDRDKHWKDDPELSFLYTKGLEDLVVGRKKRKWFQHGELGLGKYAKETKKEAGGYEITSHGDLLLRERLCRYACMVSRTHCLLTIHGIGIHGRLVMPHTAGTTAKPRFLDLEVYTPHNSRRYQLRLHAQLLEHMFPSPQDAELLRPGNKLRLLRELSRLLYFEYELTQSFLSIDDSTLGEVRTDVTTLHRHTAAMPVDPYTWDPDDEKDPNEKEDQQQRKGGKLRLTALQRRRRIEECQRQERLAQGLPPDDPDPLPPPRSMQAAASATRRRPAGEAASTTSRLASTLRSTARSAVAAPTNNNTTAGRKGSLTGQQQQQQQQAVGGGALPPPVPPAASREPVRRRVAVRVEEYLCMDFRRQQPVNMAALRRQEMRARRRREEEEAERRRQRLARLPGWRLGLEVGRPLAISGFDCLAMVFRRPESPTIVTLRVYDRRHCSVSLLKINIAHLGRLVHAGRRPDRWDKQEERRAYLSALRRLRFRRSSSEKAGGMSVLCLEERSAADVPLLTLRMLQLRRRLPFHPPPTVQACQPRSLADFRSKAYLQTLPSSLAGDLTSRVLRGYKPRCRPRRELVMQPGDGSMRRMAGGAVRVHGVLCLFSLWWDGSVGSEGHELCLLVYCPSALIGASGGCPAFSQHRIDLGWEDAWCATIGTATVQTALDVAQDEESAAAALKAESSRQVEELEQEVMVLKHRLAQEEARAQELAAKLLDAAEQAEAEEKQEKQQQQEGSEEEEEEEESAAEGQAPRLDRGELEAALAEQRLVVEQARQAVDDNRARRREAESLAKRTVALAEDAWDRLGRVLLRRSCWANMVDVMGEAKGYEAIRGERLPPIPRKTEEEERREAEEAAAEDDEEEEEEPEAEAAAEGEQQLQEQQQQQPAAGPPDRKEEEKEAAAVLSLRYSTLVYQRVHRVRNATAGERYFGGERVVRVLMQVFQKKKGLFFVAHVPHTCERYRYMLEPELHEPMITAWHRLTASERWVQLSLCVDSLAFVDNLTEDGVEEVLLTADVPQPARVELDDDIFGDLNSLGALLDKAAEKPRNRASISRTDGKGSRPNSAASSRANSRSNSPRPGGAPSASGGESSGKEGGNSGAEVQQLESRESWAANEEQGMAEGVVEPPIPLVVKGQKQEEEGESQQHEDSAVTAVAPSESGTGIASSSVSPVDDRLSG